MSPAAAVDWLPALVVLALGTLVGAALAWKALSSGWQARRGRSVAPAMQLRDLAGKRDALLRQLQELEDTAEKRTPSQLAQERYQLELEAARVMLSLEDAGTSFDVRADQVEAAAVPRAGARSEPSRPALRGFLWGVGSATALLLLGFFVYLSARPRPAGGSVTGNLPERESDEGPARAREEAQLKSAIARNPDDVEAHLALAQSSLERREYMTVWNETAKVLERQPGNARALAYQAVVRLAMGQTAVAVELLRKSVAADPGLYESRAYLAMAYARMGRMPAVRSTIASASRRFPDRAADLQSLLADLEKEGAVPPSGAAEEDPHAGLSTPGAASAAAEPVPSASQDRRVAGTIDLDPALKAGVAPGGILFVFARNAHASGGPPIAVKRLPAVFPAAFDLGPADSMMGQEFPERLLIEARLDADGDPTTRSPTDPKARIDDVKAGRTDVRLVLKRP